MICESPPFYPVHERLFLTPGLLNSQDLNEREHQFLSFLRP